MQGRHSRGGVVRDRDGERAADREDATAWASRVPLHLHPPSSPTGNGTAAHAIHDEPLAAVGQILLDSVDEIVRRHIEALKTDRHFSRIEMMTDVQIADHEATSLADIAQSLLITQAERVSLQSFRHTATVDA